jgi:hypothetical protein
MPNPTNPGFVPPDAQFLKEVNEIKKQNLLTLCIKYQNNYSMLEKRDGYANKLIILTTIDKI